MRTSDSRVKSVIVVAKPGDIFIHRNLTKFAPHRCFLVKIFCEAGHESSHLIPSFAANSTLIIIQPSLCLLHLSSTLASNAMSRCHHRKLAPLILRPLTWLSSPATRNAKGAFEHIVVVPIHLPDMPFPLMLVKLAAWTRQDYQYPYQSDAPTGIVHSHSPPH